MSTLIVSLPLALPTGATEWSYVLTPDGKAVGDHGKARAALLPLPRGTGAEIVAVVPVQTLSWHRVELPKGVAPGTPRLRAALEGLLEEELLDETDAVHMAVQPGARAGEACWVATCERAWLRGVLQQLEAAGRPAGRIVPEFAPEGAPALVVIGEDEQPLVVASSPEAVLALPLAPGALQLLPAVPEDAPRLAEPAVAALAEQVLQQKFALQQAAQRWIQAARTRWDLAQFDLASSSRTRAFKRLATGWGEILNAQAWRPARWAAVALVVVNLAGLNAWAWRERSALDGKREAVRQTLRETFPNVRVIVDAPVQMEREVASLRQQTGAASPRDLDALLGALALALPPGRTPSALEYNAGELRATGMALSREEFRTVATQLRSLGYAATSQGEALLLVAEDAR